VPNCAVFRFEKGRIDRRMHDGRRFAENAGQLLFLSGDYSVPFAELFAVKVGAVSGADEVFAHAEGNAEFVCSTTIDDGRTRRYIYDVHHPHLDGFKERLLARRIKPFHEGNWWRWGRRHHDSDTPRIYVNGKTRRAQPFFLHDCRNYDGAMLALFPRDPAMNLARAVELLNTAVDWHDLGFVCDGRYLFTQRSLQHCRLPAVFSELRT
jgi:adenine-specific DNA-methyltransferase